MILGLSILLLFQLAGEILVRLLDVPVPGPVVGMVLLFIALLIRGGAPKELSAASQGLLKVLSLLFVPAGSGVLAYWALVREEALPIAAALIVGTLVTMAVTALVLKALARRPAQRGG